MKSRSRLALALLAAAGLAGSSHALAIIVPPVLPPPPPPAQAIDVDADHPLSTPNFFLVTPGGQAIAVEVRGGGIATFGDSIIIYSEPPIQSYILVTGLGSLAIVHTDLNVRADGYITIGDGGTVTVGNQLRLGGVAGFGPPGTLNLNAGGTLTLGGTDGLLQGLGTVPFNFAGGTLKVTGAALTTAVAANLTNTSTLDTNGLAALWTGVLSGPGALVKTGVGTLTLAAANTYAGGTTITAGTLQIGNGAAAGAITGNVVNAGTLVFNRTDDSTFAGIISGGGGVALANGILRLTQAQTYTGPTQVNAGYLVLPTTVANGLSAATLVTLASGAVLDLSNQSQTVAGLSGAGTVYSYGGNSGSLEIAVAPDQSQTFSGTLGGPLPGFAVTKSGLGTLTLSGANTYTGPTTVTAGTLRVNGSLAATPVAVASGATLSGVGTLAGLSTFASGAHLAPGNAVSNAPGTLTFSQGLTLQSGSLLDFKLGTASDLIAVTGGLLSGPVGGTVTLNFSDSGGFGPGTYTLINYTSAGGTATFGPDSFTLGSQLPGYTYNLALSGNTLQLTASAIPEPSTYAALLGAAALALAAYRRRQKK